MGRESKYEQTTDPGPTRFDFTDEACADEEPGTLKALLDEINWENRYLDTNGKPYFKTIITVQTLGTVLKGIEEITGRSIPTRMNHPIPIIDLKTIKLLYHTNAEYGIQLFNLIEPPHLSEKLNLEFSTEFHTERTEKYTKVVAELQATLRKTIPDERAERIDHELEGLPLLLAALRFENTIINQYLSKHLAGNKAVKAMAHRDLAKDIPNYVIETPLATNPLPEALYTYLCTLRFAHFAAGYKTLMVKAATTQGITPINDALEAFHTMLEQQAGELQPLFSKRLSLNDVEGFVKAWATDLITLVQKATGKKTNRRQLLSLLPYIQRVLHLYTTFDHGKRNLDAIELSRFDVVAALCTIRHEQALKTPCEPYWHGQKEPSKQLLRQVELGLSIEEICEADAVPHEVNLLLSNRWAAVCYALIDRSTPYNAWMAFQVARLEKYAECFRSNDIDVITTSLAHYHGECQAMARKFVARYNEQLTGQAPHQ